MRITEAITMETIAVLNEDCLPSLRRECAPFPGRWEMTTRPVVVAVLVTIWQKQHDHHYVV